jgi:hypothetical protein
MHHGRVKHGVLGQEIIQAGNIPGFNDAVPARDGIDGHLSLSFVPVDGQGHALRISQPKNFQH